MDVAHLFALVLFLLPLAYSPGPGNQFFAALGGRVGVRGAVPALVGYHVATWVVTMAIGMGMGRALLGRPLVLSALTAVGGVYMVWLGVRAWRAAGDDGGPATPQATPGAGAVAGAALLLLNAKAYLIIAVMFAAFGDESGPVEIAWIATVFTANNLLAFVAWTALGEVVARWARARGTAAAVDRLFAAAIALVGLWLLLRVVLG